jgi:hypothetical protein
METLLNLLWLAVTLAALWLWRFRWRASRRDPQARVLPEVIAIGCALALLFPVISLTDDLHPETIAVDASSGKRNLCLLSSGATRSANLTPAVGGHSAFAVFRPLFRGPELVPAVITSPSEVFRYFLPSRNRLGRSPPSL